MVVRKRPTKARSATSTDSRISKKAKLHEESSTDVRGICDQNPSLPSAYAWLRNPVESGYIYHPKAGWIIHPSYYDDEQPLCDSKSVCIHHRDCKEVRMRMAVYQYIRAEERKTPLSYREVELLWGVSHSTVQRRKTSMQQRSDVMFLVTPVKK